MWSEDQSSFFFCWQSHSLLLNQRLKCLAKVRFCCKNQKKMWSFPYNVQLYLCKKTLCKQFFPSEKLKQSHKYLSSPQNMWCSVHQFQLFSKLFYAFKRFSNISNTSCKACHLFFRNCTIINNKKLQRRFAKMKFSI